MNFTDQQANEMHQRVAKTQGSLKRKLKIHAESSHTEALADWVEGIPQKMSSGMREALDDYMGTPTPSHKRVRQSSKPVMNKLESDFNTWLGFYNPSLTRRPQAVTFRLANGVKYTPDFYDPAAASAWEVKGSHKGSMRDDASIKLKVFAKEYPEIELKLAWKDSTGQWQQQTILP